MQVRTRLLTAACTSALVCAALLPAQAAQLNVAGIGVNTSTTANGGSSVTVGNGGNTVGATIGGGANVASVNTNATGSTTNLGIGNTSGPLIASTTNPDGTTSANVNLGGLGNAGNTIGGLTDGLDLGGLGLGGIDLGGLIPGGNGGGGGAGGSGGNDGAAAQIRVAFGNMGPGEQQQFRLRCQQILTSPGAFDTNLVALCRMIAKLGATQ